MTGRMTGRLVDAVRRLLGPKPPTTSLAAFVLDGLQCFLILAAVVVVLAWPTLDNQHRDQHTGYCAQPGAPVGGSTPPCFLR